MIAGVEALNSLIKVSPQALQGISTAIAPGRLQIIKTSPEWLVDVAHNPHAAKELAKYLKDNPVKGKTYALFSMLKDKDIEQVLSILNNNIDEWHIIGLAGSRGLSTNQLKNKILSQKIKRKVISHNSFQKACYVLKNISIFEDRVVVFGSFLVVSAVIENCNL